MKRLLLKTALFFSLFGVLLVVGLLLVSAFVQRNDFENHETDSNLLVLKENHHYDLCFLGISHARMFSRHGNHPKVEAILDKSILNLGKGRASCGVNEQLFYLQYAYSKGVKIDTIVFFVSPVLMYAGFLNRATDTFNNEPFEFDFLIQYLRFPAENKRSRILSYVRSKFGANFLPLIPASEETMSDTLTGLYQDVVEAGFKDSYKDGYDTKIFKHNGKLIEQTIKLARQHKTEVVFLFTPALFGQWPQHAETVAFFEQMKQKYNTPYYDYATVINTPNLYYDNHHLNTRGVVLFTDSFLKPILGSKEVQ